MSIKMDNTAYPIAPRKSPCVPLVWRLLPRLGSLGSSWPSVSWAVPSDWRTMSLKGYIQPFLTHQNTAKQARMPNLHQPIEPDYQAD